jgi:hypothetical protein
MTLAIAFKGREGIVLAADSRDTLLSGTRTTRTDDSTPGVRVIGIRETLTISYFDNAIKLFQVPGQSHIGFVVSGATLIGEDPRSFAGYLPDLADELTATYAGERVMVEDIARKVGEFYHEVWEDTPNRVPRDKIHFLVAGFNEGEPYGRIYEFAVPDELDPAERLAGELGIATIGEDSIAKRILYGFDDKISNFVAEEKRKELLLPIPYLNLNLQDFVGLGQFLIRATSDAQQWTTSSQGVGGPIDAAAISRTEGLRFARRKIITTTEVADIL